MGASLAPGPLPSLRDRRLALRLPRPLLPFGRRARREFSAREALALAEPVLRRWAESDFARLCCIYAGALEGEDPAIGPLTVEGRSRLWHFDYFAPEAERFLRVQICDGAAHTEETRVRAGGLGFPQMTFRFAAYGYREDRGGPAVPLGIPGNFADSTVTMDSLREAWGAAHFERVARVNGFLAFLMPADYLRRSVESGPAPGDETGRDLDPQVQAAIIVDDPGLPGRMQVVRFSATTGRHGAAP